MLNALIFVLAFKSESSLILKSLFENLDVLELF